MRWTRGLLATVMAAGIAGTTAPAARAHDGPEIRIRTPRVAVAIGGHTRACTYVPAHFETRVVRVVVREGYWRTVVVPAAYEWRWSWSARGFVKVCVRGERTTRTWVPPVVEERVERVLVRGGWTCRGHVDC